MVMSVGFGNLKNFGAGHRNCTRIAECVVSIFEVGVNLFEVGVNHFALNLFMHCIHLALEFCLNV
jgi:hypothetical protein